MKIAFLCNQFPPAKDGVGDYTYQLARALLGHGISVHVICTGQPKSSPGITLHPISGEWGPKSISTVLDILIQIKADWLCIQYVPYGFHRRGLPFFLPKLVRVVRQTGIQVSVTFHEVQVRLQGLQGTILGILQRLIARNLCQMADRCFTSIEFYRDLLSPFRKDIYVLPIGSNIIRATLSEADRQNLRQKLFPDTDWVVSTFGRRDLASLHLALEQLTAAGHSIGLLVCGQTEQDNYPDYAYPRYYTGYLPAAEIGAFLQCSDLFVLPDYVDAKGQGGSCNKSGSLAAAYAAGLPVIGIFGDMNSALLLHQENIWMTENTSAANLSVSIRHILQNASLQEYLRHGSRQLYQQRLHWEKISTKYLYLLQHAGPVF